MAVSLSPFSFFPSFPYVLLISFLNSTYKWQILYDPTYMWIMLFLKISLVPKRMGALPSSLLNVLWIVKFFFWLVGTGTNLLPQILSAVSFHSLWWLPYTHMLNRTPLISRGTFHKTRELFLCGALSFPALCPVNCGLGLSRLPAKFLSLPLRVRGALIGFPFPFHVGPERLSKQQLGHVESLPHLFPISERSQILSLPDVSVLRLFYIFCQVLLLFQGGW